MPLFSNRQRKSEPRTKQPNETLFEFCDRLCLPQLDYGRPVVDKWFDSYPSEFKEELEARLKSREDSDHFSALFELQLYGLLKQAGVVIEPVAAQPGQSTPDFVVYEHETARAFIEATAKLGNEDFIFFTFMQNVTRQVLKETNRLRVWIKERKTTGQTAAARSFSAALLREFRHSVLDLGDSPNDDEHVRLGELEYHDPDSGWSISCTLMLWHDEAPRSTIAVAGPVESHWSCAIPILREQIEAKKKQHRNLALPVVVAISWHDFLNKPDRDDIVEALTGGAGAEPLNTAGLIMAQPAAVWAAHDAELVLWSNARYPETALARIWPFECIVYGGQEPHADT